MLWKSGDVLRLKCGFGVACWQRGKKIADTPYPRDTVCSVVCRTSLKHECTVIAIDSSDGGCNSWSYYINENVEWSIVAPFGVAYFNCRRVELAELMSRGVIRILGR